MTDHVLNTRLTIAGVLWWALVALSFVWNLHQANHARQTLAFETARAFFDQILIARRWNARHGGVYIPVTEDTQPNPYLKIPDRDLRISDKLTLTLVNPAFMTRQLSEIAQEQRGIQFRITSLNPLRPANKPTDWEAEALRQFEQGVAEKGEFVEENAQLRYRYMAPLLTEKPCLRCHKGQGYEEGDIRGGISVTLPTVATLPLLALSISHLVIALGGTLILVVMGQMLAISHRKLRHQAEIDPLTAIPNRRFLNQRLLQEFQRRRRQPLPLSLILCDIDHFKAYNDHFGHPAGDHCLQLVAQSLQQSLQRASDFCARYGGEEFVLVLPNADQASAILLAEKVRLTILNLRLDHPHSTAGVVSMSFGIATDTGIGIGTDPSALIQRADQALYRAKQSGRNRVECNHSNALPPPASYL